MDSVSHFQRAVLYDHNSVGLEYFQRKEGLIFEKEEENWRIDVFVHSSDDLHEFEKEIQDDRAQQSATDTPLCVKRTGTDNVALVPLNLKLDKIREFADHTRNNFKIFYLGQRTSYSRIQLSRDLYNSLLKACNVFPKFREFTIGFGFKRYETETGPPRIVYRPFQSRSIYGFECAYIVRYIEFTSRPGSPPWSLRQYAVYHKFSPDPMDWCSTWIILGKSKRTEQCANEYAIRNSNLKDTSPFELHTLFLDVAISSWRPYIVDLLAEVKDFSNRAVTIMVGRKDCPEKFVSVDVHDHQQLKEIEDRTSDMMLCLDSTLDTLTTLISMHKRAPIKPEVTGICVDVGMILEEKMREAAYVRKCAEALLSKVQNTRSLISSILERQSAFRLQQQMSTLHSLEQEAQKETTVMRELAEKASGDSTSVRILTIITLIYLPFTVVASFYSTQFVKQDDNDGKVRMMYASNVWLFAAVSLPLTLVTILVWYIWVTVIKVQRSRRSRPANDTGQSVNRFVKPLSLRKEDHSLPH